MMYYSITHEEGNVVRQAARWSFVRDPWSSQFRGMWYVGESEGKSNRET